MNLTRSMVGSDRRPVGKWQGAGGHSSVGRRGLDGTGPVCPRRGAKGPWIARGWREGRRGGLGCRAGSRWWGRRDCCR